MGEPFTHLHVHTEYSMLDGAARITELVAKAVTDGQPAIGITDHGNMYGVLDFYRECNAQGIKPVIGTEAYMAHEHRSERPSRRGRTDDSGGDVEGGNKLYYHLTLLAENNEGYSNLLKLSSLAFLEGYYFKPRMDWELLERHHDGLIATTGCLGGHVLQSLLRADDAGALAAAGRLQDIFGRDNLFVELQDHGLPDQRRTNPKLLEIAKQLGAPLLATNDSHYTHREDHEAHDALLCVQTNAELSDPKRFKFEGQEHYLKSASEMRYLFREVPESCDNTLWIAERAEVEIEFGKVQLPDFPLPAGVADDKTYLEQLTWKGARQRWGDELPQQVVARIAYELQVICDMDFAAYFLITWDLIRFARESQIRVGPGRGSAAGCAVAYALRITDIDPIGNDLLFERFLNPSRISMPDIDMDFDSRYRDTLINYAAKTYGRDHVAQIITFGTIKARAAVRDAARVLGFSYGLGDKIAKAMPPLVMGRDTPLKYCFEQDPKYADGYKAAVELRAMYDSDPDVKKVVDVASGLEGLKRSDGIHAAAVVITHQPLTSYMPVQRKPESGQDPNAAPLVTQYEMHGVEELGLLKMDFLGVRNLDVISDTMKMVGARRNPTFDIDTVPLDDQLVFELLSRGDGIGVFQLEGAPVRALMRSLGPSSFDDVAALMALYRPGPMAAKMHTDYADRKNGRKPVEYLHPDLEELLGDTYGLMIYQESIMRVAQKCAGYSLAEADNLRKACLPAGTRLLTRSRGYVPIERILCLRDRRVQTIDTEACTTRFDSVADVWSVGVKALLRLTTSTGYTIDATADHPFLVENVWRPLGQIRPGDLVGVAARTRSEGGAKVSDAAVELSALLISEGYTPNPCAGGSATNIGIPTSFLGEELARRQQVTGRTKGQLGVDGGGHFRTRVLHRRTLDGLLYSERLEDLRTGDLLWDTVVSVEEAGEAECFDFRMTDQRRPYALAEDFLVHNCGKKDRALIAKEREKFIEGCERIGYGTALGTELFDIIEPFADYAFGKSHAFGYARVAYQTAYLKAHYPVEFMACLLTSVRSNLDRVRVYLADARAAGVKVLSPDVNRSDIDFTALAVDQVPAGVELAPSSPGAITFGLSAVRNVGRALVVALLEERDVNGPFADFYDFVQRVPEQVLNRRTVESLIKAGAFDSFGHTRLGLLMVFEQIIDSTVARRRERQQGVMNLFFDVEDSGADPGYSDSLMIPDVEFEKSERLRAEKEMLGLYVSDHPLTGVERALRRKVPQTISQVVELDDRAVVTVGGVVTNFTRKYTRKGDQMATFLLEDLESSVEVTVFPRTLAEEGHKFSDDSIVIVRGRVDRRDESLASVNCQTVEVVTGLGSSEDTPVRLRLGAHRLDQARITELKRILADHPGASAVFLELGDGKVLRLSDEFCVDVGRAAGELRMAFGHDAVVL